MKATVESSGLVRFISSPITLSTRSVLASSFSLLQNFLSFAYIGTLGIVVLHSLMLTRSLADKRDRFLSLVGVLAFGVDGAPQAFIHPKN